MSKHSYKLIYATKRGRAEPIRSIFHYHGMPFNDYHIPTEEWAKMKPNTPTGQMPMLEVDGKMELGQTLSICRYLAKALDPESYFAGSTKPEAAFCDMYVDIFANLFDHGIYVKYSSEGARSFLVEIFKNYCNNILPILDKRIRTTGKYLCGNKILWCDVYAVTILSLLEENVGEDFVPWLQDHHHLVDFYHRMRQTPKLRSYIEENWPEAKVKF